tara:strand:- start:60 stop:233 length:174 start_codon:yes stop_codon:yes gene_type:complete
MWYDGTMARTRTSLSERKSAMIYGLLVFAGLVVVGFFGLLTYVHASNKTEADPDDLP